jgi:hypothetical protein
VLLGESLNLQAMLAVVCGTLGVLLLSPDRKERPLRSLIEGRALATR